jgi:hypothetical protein
MVPGMHRLGFAMAITREYTVVTIGKAWKPAIQKRLFFDPFPG